MNEGASGSRSLPMFHLKGWFGEIRCTAKKSLTHVRGNAASAKTRNRLAVLSAHCEFAEHQILQLQPMSAMRDASASFEYTRERQEWAVRAATIWIDLRKCCNRSYDCKEPILLNLYFVLRALAARKLLRLRKFQCCWAARKTGHSYASQHERNAQGSWH